MRNLPTSESTQCPVCLKRESKTYHTSLCVCKVCGTYFQIVSESKPQEALRTEISKHPVLLQQKAAVV